MSGNWKSGCATAMVLALSACGGGGSEGTNSVPPAPAAPISLPTPMPLPVTAPSSENFDTEEYRRSTGAVGSNAIGAWEMGATGKGITIGFVDTGLVPTLSDFAGRIHPESRDVEGNRPMDDVYGHGTALAGIAAAARDGRGVQGIAFESTIFMAKADHGCPSNCKFDPDATGAGIDAARAAGAKVISISLAGDGGSEIWEAADRAIDAGIVFVISAGNSGSSPSHLAAKLASLAPNQVIIVGGLGTSNPDGTINYDRPSIYTTPASASQWSFLTAPGWLVGGSYFLDGGGLNIFSGTSFASPVVAGAVALVAQAFPMLTPEQIVGLLYVTADDLGVAGVDSVFGRGRLNIGRAFQPVGITRMAGANVAPPASLGALPSAAGDAASRGGLTATVLDEFDRPFSVDLAHRLVRLVESGLLTRSISVGQRQIHGAIGPISLAFSVDHTSSRPKAFRDLELTPSEEKRARLHAGTAISKLAARFSFGLGFGTALSELQQQLASRTTDGLTLSGNATQGLGFDRRDPKSFAVDQKYAGWRLSFGGELGDVKSFRIGQAHRYAVLGLGVERPLLRGRMRFGLTRLIEQRTVLGGSIDRMFGKLGSQTWFADAEIEQEIGNGWSVSGTYRRGQTKFANGRFTTSAFSTGVTKLDILSQHDRLAFRLSQPLRVEAGAVALQLPVSWDYERGVATEGRQELDLSPSGRELTLEAAYQQSMPRGWLSLNLYGRRDPAHVKQSDYDIGLAVRVGVTL